MKKEGEINVFVVDGNPIYRMGLCELIRAERGLHLNGCAGSVEEALEPLKESPADVAIADVILPGKSGFQLTPFIQKSGLKTKVLIMTSTEDCGAFYEAMDVGVHGYIGKDVEPEAVTHAVEHVVAGGTCLGREYEALVMGQQRSARKQTGVQQRLSALTESQIVVLGKIANFMSNKEISHALDVSVRTVEKHREQIARKLGLRGSNRLIEYAARHREAISDACASRRIR